tara:strand:- start:170 stop:577 length:408 start_codon:yes stop_codon:yes gene_type:complete
MAISLARQRKPLTVLVGLLIVPCLLVLPAGCARSLYNDAEEIKTCNRKNIEIKIQELMDISISNIEKINEYIAYKNFKSICSGEFEGRTPIGSWFGKLPYPEISFPWNINYRIGQDIGICITADDSVAQRTNCYK